MNLLFKEVIILVLDRGKAIHQPKAVIVVATLMGPDVSARKLTDLAHGSGD